MILFERRDAVAVLPITLEVIFIEDFYGNKGNVVVYSNRSVSVHVFLKALVCPS